MANKNSYPFTADIALLFFCALLFGSMAWMHGNEALWNDEIYTLQYFVLKGLPTVLGDYHVPNNHILSNVLHWGWLRLLGIDTLDPLLDDAWKIRLLPGLLSAATLYVLYRCGRLLAGKTAGWAAVILLLTTLGFGNFAFQVRGYPLTMLLSTGLLYGALRVWRDGQCDWKSWAGMAAATTALLYTIPSNLYAAVAAGGVLTALATWKSPPLGLKVASAFAAGAVVALALYWPILHQVTHNEYVQTGKPLQAVHWQNLKTVLSHTLSWRLLLLPVVAWGCWLLRKDSAQRGALLLFAGVFILPFLISALRGDTPPPRSFLVTVPALLLFAAYGWQAALAGLSSQKTLVSGLAAGGILLCLFTYWHDYRDARRRIEKGMMQNMAFLQDINYNYYQFYYRPNEEYDLFKQKKDRPVLIVETAEDHDMPVYLKRKGIDFLPLDSIYTRLRTQNTLYVSTRYPRNFIQNLQKVDARWQCFYLQPEVRYPRIVVCQRR